MKGKKILATGIFLVAFAFVVFLNLQNVNAAGETFCCQKTIDSNPNIAGNQPAWCQNVNDVSKCDENYNSAPTSCEATSYCKLGTCVDNQEGLCVENAPEATCSPEDGGTWYDSTPEEIPQCQLGCCLIGDQAAFTTQVRCKQLSADYGLETNYRTDIQSEEACIDTAGPKAKGACVFEEEFQRTCQFVSRSECQDLGVSNAVETEFYENFLCSNKDLGTNCGMSEKTKIIDGRDEVFFVDTCGNQANIYDSSRINDQGYWDEIVQKVDSCVLNVDLRNANSCGNCDYLAGSVGKLYDRAVDGSSSQPDFGNYICRDLNCNGYVGEDYTLSDPPHHGETWCAYSGNEGNARGISQIRVDANGQVTDSGNDLPGGRYFRKVCYNGDVTIEACGDFRQEVCVQSSVNGFATAACRTNKWQECGSMDNAKDCLNTDIRDCSWMAGERTYNSLSVLNSNAIIPSEGSCVPRFAPGFNFWEGSSDAGSLCASANERCVVEYESEFEGGGTGALGKIAGAVNYLFNNRDEELLDTELKGKVTCLDEDGNVRTDWITMKRNQCLALGDCGSSVNFMNVQGSGHGDVVNVENN